MEQVREVSPEVAGFKRRKDLEPAPKDDNPLEDDRPHVYEGPDGKIYTMDCVRDEHGRRKPDVVLQVFMIATD